MPGEDELEDSGEMRRFISDALKEYSYHLAGLICFLRFLTYHLYNTVERRICAVADIKRNSATSGPICIFKKVSDTGEIVCVTALYSG